jgi:hypothetical protein
MRGWGQSRRSEVRRWLPVYPNEQTSSGSSGMSQRCHIRTWHSLDVVGDLRLVR